MAQSFVVRKHKQGDEKGIFQLVRLCYDRVERYDYWMKRWVWENKENPFGKDVWVVEHKGQIVAHVSHIPANLKVGKKVLKSGIPTWAMTHPKFRRRGLQRKINAILGDELVRAGICFSYYFPGEIFQKHKIIGREYKVCKIPRMTKYLDTYEVMRKMTRSRFLARVLSVWINPPVGFFFRSKGKPILENVKISKILQFDDRVNDFWKDVSRYFNVIAVRNREYLNWRYFKRPNSNFMVLLAEEDEKILGYIVFCSRDERGFIVDLLVFPHRLDVIQSLVLRAMEQLRAEKVHRIICWMTKNNPYYKVLLANGFIPRSSRRPLTVATHSPSDAPIKFLKNPNNWYLTLGDTDGILIH